MNRQNTIQYLIVFLIGVLIGGVFEFIGLELSKIICNSFDCIPITFTFWGFIPLPILVGLGLVINVANYPSAD